MAGGGSKPGERRGGRKKGTPNKSTAEIREIAGAWGEPAILKLADLMENGTSEQIQLAAAREILDRGFGRTAQTSTAQVDSADIRQQIEQARASVRAKMERAIEFQKRKERGDFD